MSELLKKLFEGVEGLTPEFFERAETLMKVAISEEADKRIEGEATKLNESFDTKLEEAKQELISETAIKMDAFLDKTMLEWAKENAVALDAIAKVELAESFLTGMRGLFEQASITIPKGDEKAVLEGLQTKVVELEGKLEEAELKLEEQTAILESQKREEIISSVCASAELAETTIERVKKITADFALTNEEEFRKKVGYVVEALGGVIKEECTPEEKEAKEKEEAEKKAKEEAEKKKANESQTPVTQEPGVVPVQESVKVVLGSSSDAIMAALYGKK